MKNDYGNVFTARRGCWLFLVFALSVFGNLALSQAMPNYSVRGYGTLTNGSTAAISNFSNGGGTIHYTTPSGSPANTNAPLSLNKGKLARAMLAGRYIALPVLLAWPSAAGDLSDELCFQDIMCTAQRAAATCTQNTGPDSNGVTRSWMNFSCISAQTAEMITALKTPDTELCLDAGSKALYACIGPAYQGRFGQMDIKPVYSSTSIYKYNFRAPTEAPCLGDFGDGQCLLDWLAGLTSAANAALADWLSPDSFAGDPSTWPFGYRDSQSGKPSHWAPVVPDIWDPISVPDVAPTDDPALTQPETDPDFDPTTNPINDPANDPFGNPENAPVTDPDPSTDPTTDPNGNPTTNVDVTVNFPSEMDVRVTNDKLDVRVTNETLDVRVVELPEAVPNAAIEGFGPVQGDEVAVGSLDSSGWLPSSCPQGSSANYMGANIEFDMQPMCSAAASMSGLIMALGLLAGLYIAIGALR